MQILIADDDPDGLIVLRKILESAGHNVTSCEDGHEALAGITGIDSPSLVILDWEMPGLDGLEVVRRARQADLATSPYIILLTARNKLDSLVEGLDSGADDYITKPFAQPELIARLQSGIRVLNLQQKLKDRLQELELAQKEIQTLHGLITVCSHCRRIKDDDGVWLDMEEYVRRHADVRFSHGICRTCIEEIYPKYTGNTKID